MSTRTFAPNFEKVFTSSGRFEKAAKVSSQLVKVYSEQSFKCLRNYLSAWSVTDNFAKETSLEKIRERSTDLSRELQ